MAKLKCWKKLEHSERPRFFNSKTNQQITIQETYGRGKKRGAYESVLFNLNKGLRGKELKVGSKSSVTSKAYAYMKNHDKC